MKIPHLTIPRLLTAIVFIAIFTMAVRVPADTDTWWHLAAGRYMVAQRAFFSADPFSHTFNGTAWYYPKLGEIFLYGLYALGGWAALSLAVAGLVTASFWLVWRQIEANPFVAAFSVVLGAIVSSVVWVARPQMISFLLTALTAYLLHRFKRHNGRLLPWLPLVMVLWANVHGGFAIGLMLMLAYLLGETVNHLTGHEDDPVIPASRLKHLLLVIGLSLAAVAVNPYTWRMWLYPFQTVGIDALRDFIQEWQSPNFHLPYVQPFAVMLLLILAAMARSRRSADWTDLALVGMWAMSALFAARNIAIFGLVTAPILARYADTAWIRQWEIWGYARPPFSAPGRLKPHRIELTLNWLLLTLIVAAALVKIYLPLTPTANLTAEQDSLPYGAVEFIRQHQPPGPMFNSYNWGGYFIFKLWPAYPVYIDGRTDLYDDAFIRRYLGVMLADDDWAQVLADDGIRLVVIEQNSVLDKFLRRDSGWRELYRDDMAVIFGRK
jgi:hypothetical protein